ncbi:MAG: sulfatase [Verrucomicrobiota bacterium]
MFRLFILLIALSAAPTPAAQPNVIVILADDLGWSDTTLYGTTTLYQTPNLERLAKRGMTFTRAYSASPLCSPTRSALLTGLSPARTGITTPNCHMPQVVLQATTGKKAPPDQKAIMPDPPTRLKTEYRTLAEMLKDAGYATAHFGKWHLGPEPYSPLQQGFNVDLPHHPGPGPAGSFVAPWKFANFKEKSPGEHIEDRMAAEAVAWMEQQKEKPFYLNYWMFSVHAPFDAKKANIETHRDRIDPKDGQRSPTYAAMIQSMDDAIGTLLDGLDRLKLEDNTIIIFTADNGGNMYNEVDGTTPTSNRPLRGGKATMFEGGTRVPGVVVWPGIAAPGSRSDAIIQSEDYYPTLLEALALKPAEGQRFDGHSILPALKGDALAGKAVFQYFPHNPGVPDWLPPSVSVHRDDWKLIRIFHGGENGGHRHLLFNLREDLSENNNLAEQRPELVTELDALIEIFLADTKAVVPVKNPAFDPSKYHPEREGKQQPKGKAKAPAKPATKGKADGDPALQGWKARDCRGAVKDGILRLTNIGSDGFLGFSAGKHSGPTTVKFRIKAKASSSHLDWLPGGVGSKQEQADFTLQGGGWEEIRVELPAVGPLGIVRLYLPMQEQAVEIDWIELMSKSGSQPTRTAF